MGGFIARVAAPIIAKPKPVAPQVQKAAVRAAPRGPTVAEVDDFSKIKLATNRRGRRALILTSTKGVDENITLGTKTLLG
jgi:hypothetical protein